jgi:hypothetical protein
MAPTLGVASVARSDVQDGDTRRVQRQDLPRMAAVDDLRELEADSTIRPTMKTTNIIK